MAAPVEIEFCLLGPLAVRRDGVAVPVSSGKQSALLAALLLHAGQPVSSDHLMTLLWGDAPPPSAVVSLQNYIRRLRRVLGDERHRRIATCPGSYLINVAAGELDITRLETALAAARAAARAGAWQQAAELAAAAIALWRGEPLCDVDLPLLVPQEAARLTELFLQARETRIEAEVALARHTDVVIELQSLVADHPLREHLRALLIRALYRCGRRAEALDAYHDIRTVLVRELGSEPGPALQALHQQVLTDDSALAVPAPPPGNRIEEPAREVPRQLPAVAGCFTGRAAELAALTGMLGGPAGADGHTVVLSAIGGTAGVGKTALAVQWAHQIAGRFPDGQLYVNLRGYDSDAPMTAADALAGMLRALGVPGADIPDETEQRAGLYRSQLAGRRMLVLLDNARDGDQVRPLLPGDPGCAAVVTSRDALAGLVAVDGAQRLDLDVLPLADAVALLRSLIGSRADDDREAAAALAGLCARLPLALRIAAEMAAARPAAPLAELAAELKADRLDLLDAGEDRADVRAVFSWSFRQLPDDVAAAFVLIGLHPGQDLDAHAAAALTGTTAGQARRVLSRLQRASLLQAAGSGRYGMHDLLRAYARERADVLDGDARDAGDQRDQALTRLFDYYLSGAAAAVHVLFPAEAYRRPRIPAAAAGTAGPGAPGMAGEAGARSWLDAERANLVAVTACCAGRGWAAHATGLAGTLFRYLENGGYLTEAHAIHSHALHAAGRAGDLAGQADALNGLGCIAGDKGRFGDAAGHFRAALECYRRCGDRAGQARILHNLGQVAYGLHDLQAAAGYYRECIAAHEDTGDHLGVARTRCSLADVETGLGRYAQASEHLRLSLPVLRDAKDRVREARAVEQIGELALSRGQLSQAAASFEQALTLYHRLGNRDGVAGALANLGDLGIRQGRYRQAISHLRQALALFRQTGSQPGENLTLLSLAQALHGAGQPAAARAELAVALRLAAETGNTFQQATAHRDLAESYHRGNDGERARRHWEQALELYTQLGAPEADQVLARLGAQDAKAQR
jgi:DNA-binding SARP family transcriptional activator